MGYNRYVYCGNNPVNRTDSSGFFWDYVLDAVFICIGIYDFIQDPSWENAGWLLLDIALAVVPFVPSLSAIRHLGKADDVVDIVKAGSHIDDWNDLTKAYGHIDDFADAGGTIRKATAADFAGNGWDLVKGLDTTKDGFTRSNRLVGTRIHSTFMDNGVSINAHNRVDGLDMVNHIVYELKPNNPRSIKRGIQQLKRYQDALFEKHGIIYDMVLVLY